MPTVDTAYDGGVYRYSGVDWATQRAEATGTVTAGAPWMSFTYNLYKSGRGGVITNIGRFFMQFDTSGISVAPSSATLKIHGQGSVNSLDVILVRGTQSGATHTSHYNDIYNASTELGNSDGSGTGTLAGISGLAYSSELVTWNASGYNDFTLNATALSDIASEDDFKVVLIGYDADYLDIASLGLQQSVNIYQKGYGSSYKPYIDYTEASATTESATFFGCNF